MSDGMTGSTSYGGTVHWVYSIDWSIGYPTWSGRYGAAGGYALSNRLVLHPTLDLFCGFISFIRNFDSNCDLDFTVAVNTGDSNPAPGNPLNWWSLFSFCQNVSSDVAVLPPAWTHTISSTGDDGSQRFVDLPANGWAGNDVLIQAVCRRGSTVVPQGLQWPTTGIPTSSSIKTLLFLYTFSKYHLMCANHRWRIFTWLSERPFHNQYIPVGSKRDWFHYLDQLLPRERQVSVLPLSNLFPTD